MKTGKRKRKTIGRSTLEKIDDRITLLQKATKTDYPPIARWHVELCRRFPLYYEWHKHPNSESIHWMILTLLCLYTLALDLVTFRLAIIS